MRVLLVSDLHYRLRQFDWLLERAVAVDAVMIAGDLLDIRSQVALDVQAVAVRAALRELAAETTLFVASGNHDLDGRDDAGEKVAHWMAQLGAIGVHGDYSSVRLGDDLVTVCPWWDGPRARAALEAYLAEVASRPRARWIWVHHAPPAGSPLAWDGHRAWGDDQLSTWIKRFTRTSCSPVMSTRRRSCPAAAGSTGSRTTWVVNPASNPGRRPRALRSISAPGRRCDLRDRR